LSTRSDSDWSAGKLGASELRAVDDALMLVLGLCCGTERTCRRRGPSKRDLLAAHQGRPRRR